MLLLEIQPQKQNRSKSGNEQKANIPQKEFAISVVIFKSSFSVEQYYILDIEI